MASTRSRPKPRLAQVSVAVLLLCFSAALGSGLGLVPRASASASGSRAPYTAVPQQAVRVTAMVLGSLPGFVCEALPRSVTPALPWCSDGTSASASASASVSASVSASASPGEPLLVLGAGLGRTGTDSLQAALHRLGYRAYHMRQAFVHGHCPLWRDLARAAIHARMEAARAQLAGYECQQSSGTDNCAQGPTADPTGCTVLDAERCGNVTRAYRAEERAADRVLDAMGAAGFNATTDFPACLALRHMLRRNPTAAVVLGVRSPRAWADSYAATIGPAMLTWDSAPLAVLGASDVLRWMHVELGLQSVVSAGEVAWPPPLGHVPSHASLQAAFSQWVARVRAMVPASQLLEHSPQDGYPPLCAHLRSAAAGVCVAASDDGDALEAYPHINSRGSMEVETRVLVALVWVWKVGPALCLLAATVVVASCACGCLPRLGRDTRVKSSPISPHKAGSRGSPRDVDEGAAQSHERALRAARGHVRQRSGGTGARGRRGTGDS